MSIIEERTEENSLVSYNPADEVLREKYLKNRSYGNYFGRIGSEQQESYSDAEGRITENAKKALEKLRQGVVEFPEPYQLPISDEELTRRILDTMERVLELRESKDILDTSFVDSMYKEADID
ncbi:hypothetical protein PP935_gp181 [Rhizobium phage RHph_N34]|uniref:Uncharacterized protein n=1 Tax=Rhizobium phage RHph_N34 TaxID=2509586 RepID=A0A7S5UYW3_9CAUD|nr:hypothetical protein PP935_gp181 [Rhizobium phage RHph_N34]QIG73956.1 hypothetical protein EVC06_181 [Rhizobium phage RHph_N34]